MIEIYQNLKNYLFPVFIYKDTEVLTIIDGRLGRMQIIIFLSGLFLLGFSVIFSLKLIDAGFYWILVVFITGAIVLIIKALLEPYKLTYIFDKRIDTYTFVSRSLIKSEIEQGSLSQFRGVQIERRLISTDDGTTENYHVTLLKNEGLLFGTPPPLILREGNSHPIFSNLSSETRTANVVVKFMNFSSTDVVDVL